MTESRNVVGAQLIVLINGRIIGEVTSFSFSSMSPHPEVHGLDQVTPFELMTNAVKVAGTIGVLRQRTSGGLEGRGIVAPFNRIPEQRYFSLLVVNRRDQSTFFRADRCMVQQQQWEVQARGRVSGSFSFAALDWVNEAAID